MRTRVACAVVAGAAVWSSCVAHTAVGPVPDVDAPLDERVDAYDRLRPKVAVAGRTFASAPILVLADGTVVDDPTDLAPAVTPDAATLAHAAHAADDAMLGRGFTIASAGVVTVGAAALIGFAAVAPERVGPSESLLFAPIAGTVGGLVLAAVLVPAVWFDDAAVQERAAAFAAYDRDLRARLVLKPTPSALAQEWSE